MTILICTLLLASIVYLLQRLKKTNAAAKKIQVSNSVLGSKNSELSLKNEALNSQLKEISDEKADIESKWKVAKSEYDKYAQLIDQIKHVDAAKDELNRVTNVLKKKNDELTEIVRLVDTNVQHKELKESGFYEYRYEFEDILHYREAIQIIKEAQKALLTKKEVLICPIKELADSDVIKSLRKIVLCAFNNEFELISARLNSTNFESCKAKLVEHFDYLNEEISVFKCNLNKKYLELKVKELALALEYEIEIQRSREEQSALKEQMRDEERAREEAEALQAKAIQEEEKFEKLLETARKEVQAASKEEQEAMLKKISELEQKLSDAHLEKERATSLAQLTKKGHVYIISNIGSFGEQVFKIGLTRRENPLERVHELGDASVPFKFDVHAVIKSEDAPHLESSLHQRLDEFRMNRVNSRKEFFRVSLDKIASICTELGYEIALTHMAEAREYRQTLELIKSKNVA